MRAYKDENQNVLESVSCNCCGKTIKVENGIIKEGCFRADTLFGYFSHKDGARHQFDLCENCYDKIVADFLVPVEELEEKELL